MKFQKYKHMALAALLIGSASCSSCKSQAVSESRLPCSIDELQIVAVPDSVASAIVHYPGFYLSFNTKHHVPNWVAWELTGEESLAQEAHRKKSSFMTDAAVEGCPGTADYKNSGYTRGHMCPAGDMKWSQEAMNACFNLTNITPQAEALNNGAWKKLEEKCRVWAQRDSAIIIICGPVLTDSIDERIGSTGVAVPKRFFKVVLAPYAEPMRGIGFIMENGHVAGGMQAAAVSIDDIEEITGYDFFAPLPDVIENKLESECNFPRWSAR